MTVRPPDVALAPPVGRFSLRRFVGSVRVRLTFAVSATFAIALTLVAFGLVRQVERALVNDMQVRNDTLARALAKVVAADPASAWSTSDPSQLPFGGSGYDRDLLNAGLNESIVYVHGPGSAQVAPSSNFFERIRHVVTGEAVPLFRKVLPARIDANQYVVSEAPVHTSLGTMTLSVASSLDPVSRTVDRVEGALFFAVPTLVAAVAILSWLMTGQALRPVSAISSRAREITASTLDQRVPEPDTDDEIGQLARTMNAMLDRLESASERQRRFISDASHELRSPVAAIRLQVETALMHPDQADWEAVGRTVIAEDQRLSSLVDNLLALARIEEDMPRPRSEVDLDEICHDQLARPRSVPVDRSEVLAGRVFGVRDELTSVVRNLVDNAERHATSQVKVSLATRGPWVRLEVHDDGPGIDPNLRDKVFERFTRLQEARSRDVGGAGLGLALTKRVVETHGGRVFVEESPLGGAAFVVELPSADVPSADDAAPDDVDAAVV